MTSNRIPIIFSCSNSYLTYLSVAIQSISNTASPWQSYDIYIMHNTNFNVRKASQIQRTLRSNVSIHFVNVSSLINEFPLPLTARTHVTEESYYKLLIPRIFNHLEKVIYLDVDLIVQKDLSLLYNCELEDKYIGGVLEYLPGRFASYVQNSLGINRYEYINAGVLLMDCQKLQGNHLEEKCRSLLASNPSYYMLNQDVLNISCSSHIQYLDPRWNLTWNTRARVLYEVKAPFILHYTSRLKPWNTKNRLISDSFWETSRTCAFARELKIMEDALWTQKI